MGIQDTGRGPTGTAMVLNFPRGARSDHGRTFRGRVSCAVTAQGRTSQTLAFVGRDESDVLHAVADFMADQPTAQIRELIWTDQTHPFGQLPEYRLELRLEHRD